MNVRLEKMKKEAEMKSVEAAKFQQMLKIEERLDEIERLKASMAAQDKRIAELAADIATLATE